MCSEGDFTELLFKVGQGLEEEERHLMVTVARGIWLRQNKFVFEGVFQAPAIVVRIAKEQVVTFDDVARRHADPRARNIARQADIWRKPPQGLVKINWDAAVDKEKDIIGMGVIIRDSSGETIAMHCEPKASIIDPSLAKALAARTITEFGLSLGIR